VQNEPQRRAIQTSAISLTTLTRDELIDRVHSLEHRLAWFERQLFGQKSERLKLLDDPRQLLLGTAGAVPSEPPSLPTKPVAAHERRRATRDVAASSGEADSLPFFDRERVPVETIEVLPPEVAGLAADSYEVIGAKRSYRLAQRPGSYVVLEYVRPVVKPRTTATEASASSATTTAASLPALLCAPAPRGVLDGSRADVSFLAGLLVDKFAWHLPLYRQHQRLAESGIEVSRSWLTQLTQSALALLAPVYAAQLQSIRSSRVIAMDETPIKAGRSGHGKMKSAYFWPVYGEKHEVCFPFRTSREAVHIAALLGARAPPGTVLLTDGYAAYEAFAKATQVTHAQCWAHARREVYEAQAHDPERARTLLEHIAGLYAIEERIRAQGLTGEAKRLMRVAQSKPRVEALFALLDAVFAQIGLLPATPFTKALGYLRDRKAALSVFLEDPEVPLDTNHLERALRPIPMGRKNWNFCWTELGARDVGIAQSLIVTCRLHGLDVYDYLVDVLQRIGEHPASHVAELTPRQWKTLFAHQPKRSPLHTRAP
jgi:transposase